MDPFVIVRGRPGDEFPSKPGRVWGMGTRFRDPKGTTFLVVGACLWPASADSVNWPPREGADVPTFEISLNVKFADGSEGVCVLNEGEIDALVEHGAWKIGRAERAS